jgi:hypothetical protein
MQKEDDSEPIYQTARQHVPGDTDPHIHSRQNPNVNVSVALSLTHTSSCVPVHWFLMWGARTHRGKQRHLRRYTKTSYGVRKLEKYLLFGDKH